MTDWADEIADKLTAAGEHVGQCKAVAIALRMAKADGMREACVVVQNYMTGLLEDNSGAFSHCGVVCHLIREKACEIDPSSESTSEQNGEVRIESNETK